MVGVGSTGVGSVVGPPVGSVVGGVVALGDGDDGLAVWLGCVLGVALTEADGMFWGRAAGPAGSDS